MTKSYVKFASLFAVVALFLGLMVTGCSEGNNTPGEVGAKTLLNTVVGISPEVAGKGYADAATKYLAVGVTDKDGLVYVDEEAVGELYSADGKIGAEAQEAFGKDATATAWEDLGDNEVLTSMVLDEYVLAQNPTGIAVFSFDKSGNPLGVFMADVDFNAQGITAVDLVEEGTEFIAVKDMDCEITVANAGEDKVMHLMTGETKEVEVQAVYSYKGEEVGRHSVAGFTMETKSENIALDNAEGTVKGEEASEAKDNEVKVAWTHPVTEKVLECTFNVKVEDLYVTLTCADGMFPDWSNGEYVTIDSVRVNNEEQLYGGEELTWDGKESQTEYILDTIPVGVEDVVAVHCVKHGVKELEGEAEEITVTTDAVANTVTVTGWRDVAEFIRVALKNGVEGQLLVDGDVVLYDVIHNKGVGEKDVVWECDGTSQETLIVPCQEGDTVTVANVRVYKGGILLGDLYNGQFEDEEDTCTVTAKKDGGEDNKAVIVKWVKAE